MQAVERSPCRPGRTRPVVPRLPTVAPCSQHAPVPLAFRPRVSWSPTHLLRVGPGCTGDVMTRLTAHPGRDSFPSYGSSRSKPPCRSRSCRSSAWPPRFAGADGAPTEVSVGSCPSRARRDSNPSIPGVIGHHPSRGARPVGRRLPFGPGHVPTRIHPVTGWPSLLPTSPTRTPIGSPYGARSQREMYGVPTFRFLSLSG